MPNPAGRGPVYASGALALASLGVLVGVWVWRSGSAGALEGRRDDGRPAARSPAAPESASAIERILDTADALVRDGEIDRAAAVLKSAIAQHPDDQELRLASGGALIMLDRLPEAYREYEAALAIGPRTPGVEFDAGVIATRLDLLERAEEHFSAAQTADNSDPRYPLYLAQVLTRQGRTEEARKQLLLATRIDESLATAWGSLAELSLRDNDGNIALHMIARARQLQPGVTAWRVIEARALKRLARPAEALAALEPIAKAERRSLPILRLIGEIRGMLGEGELAAAEFEAAALDDPANGDLQFETAVWLERVGRLEDARRFAARAAELGVASGAQMADRLAQQPGE